MSADFADLDEISNFTANSELDKKWTNWKT